MEQLKKNRGNPEAFLALISEIKNLGLESDNAVKAIFLGALNGFNPKQIAELLMEWPEEKKLVAGQMRFALRSSVVFRLIVP